jgi:hypothetical protein
MNWTMMKKSISVVPSIDERLYKDATDFSATCHILREDLYLPIFPFQDAQRYVSLNVLNGDEEPVRRAIELAVSNERDTHAFPQEFGEFVRSAAQTAVTYGNVSYEVVFEMDRHRSVARNEDSQFSFRIDPIMPTTMFHFLGFPVQIIPSADAKNLEND